MIRVTIVHPSFNRPDLAWNAMNEWYSKSDKPEEIEYLLSLNDDEPSLGQYIHYDLRSDRPKFGRMALDISDSKTANQSMNRTAKLMSPTSELVLVVADDQGCPEHWDSLLFDVLRGVDNFKEPRYLYVSDGLSDMSKDEGPKFGYMNRALYNHLGFLQHPDYHSLYSDNDLFECGKILGMIRAPHLVFPHRHHSRNQNEWDSTYWRTNNLEAVAQGQRVFEERKKRNFDLALDI